MRDVAAAVEAIAETGPVAVIGDRFGGSVAWLAADELPVQAAIGYYGGQIVGMIDREAEGADDAALRRARPRDPLDGVQQIAEAHPDVTVHVYQGAQHGFACDARGSYHPMSTAIAPGGRSSSYSAPA